MNLNNTRRGREDYHETSANSTIDRCLEKAMQTNFDELIEGGLISISNADWEDNALDLSTEGDNAT